MAERKHNSIYGARLREALIKDKPSPLQSEKLPSFRPFYVDRSILEKLHNNSNELVVGRRGTGKTHLLGTFNEFIEAECPNEMSLMISIMEVSGSVNSAIHDIDTEPFARQRHARDMFEGFLNIFFNKFLVRADTRLKQLMKCNQDFKLADSVNNSLERLLQVIEVGVPHNTKKTVRKKQLHLDSLEKKKGADARLDVGLKSFAGSLGATIGKGITNTDTDESVTEIDAVLEVDLYLVRELVLKVLNELNIKVLYILIDEWMELDKRASSEIQPIFAQYLKETFFNCNQFAVKIASIWHQTTLYDQDYVQRSKGVQLYHDVTQDIDLDTAFITTQEEVEEFCKALLFKRLSFRSPGLKALEKKGQINEMFITEIFDNLLNFRTFIVASHGIPRDLIDLFNKCAKRIKYDFENKCISHDLIFDEAKRKYSMGRRRNIDPNSSAQLLLQQINLYMSTTGRRLFLVENYKIGHSAAIHKLIDEELIHQVPSFTTPRCIRDEYKALLIDFGNYIDWLQTRGMDISSFLEESLLANFSSDFEQKWQTYVLDIECINAEIITCSHCGVKIKKTHPVLKKHNICPSCGEDPLPIKNYP